MKRTLAITGGLVWLCSCVAVASAEDAVTVTERVKPMLRTSMLGAAYPPGPFDSPQIAFEVLSDWLNANVIAPYKVEVSSLHPCEPPEHTAAALGSLRRIQRLPRLVRSFFRQPECQYAAM